MDNLKKGLLLLGSFAIAFIMAETLHELGHAGTALLTGGEVLGITVNPFSWSYSSSFSPNPMLHIYAGAVASSLVAIILFIALYRWTKVWLLPILLIGPITLINNGDYYLVDAIFRAGGDACSLMEMGVSFYVILSMGVLFLTIGLFLAYLLVRKLGILNTCFKNRLMIFTIGIISYLMMMFAWNYIFNRGEIITWLIFACTGTGVTIFFAILPIWTCPDEIKKEMPIGWRHVSVINFIAIVIILALLFIPYFGNTGYIPWLQTTDVNTFTERPENFPAVLKPHPNADEIGYTTVRSKKNDTITYSLSYSVPNSIQKDQIRLFLTSLYEDNQYKYLKHDFYDPNDVSDNAWIERSFTYGDHTTHYHAYHEKWLKTASEIVLSQVTVDGELEDDDIKHFSIRQILTEHFSVQLLHNYILINPDEFGPKQTEVLNELFEEHQLD